jgi:RNA polymerase sigma-70 factor (ECF subfamily)
MDSNQALSAQFHEVVTQHKGIFLKIARTYCRNAEDKQDLVQEIMIQVWRGLPRYDSKYPVSTWLYRVALNVAISFYRKQRRRLPMAGPVFEETMIMTDENPSPQQEQLQLLEQFIASLNDLDKALILLYLDDKSYAEIAQIMGLSVSNVGTKLGRVREKLRAKFEQHTNE